MISIIIFVVVAVAPIVIFLINAFIANRDNLGNRGIAAGIPKPKEAKTPRPRSKASRTREARVRSRRVTYCGRNFTHFALALVGSQDSCRYCAYLEEVPPPPQGLPRGGLDTDADSEAAVRAAEEIIDKSRQ